MKTDTDNREELVSHDNYTLQNIYTLLKTIFAMYRMCKTSINMMSRRSKSASRLRHKWKTFNLSFLISLSIPLPSSYCTLHVVSNHLPLLPSNASLLSPLLYSKSLHSVFLVFMSPPSVSLCPSSPISVDPFLFP